MRTHLAHPDGGLACGRAAHYQNTADITKVDCKSCQRTKVYKKLFADLPVNEPVVVVPTPAAIPTPEPAEDYVPVFLRPVKMGGVPALLDPERRAMVEKFTIYDSPDDYMMRPNLPSFQRLSHFEHRWR